MWPPTAGWADLVAGLRWDSGPPGYYLLLKAWMALFGDSEAALRALSASLGVVLVAATLAVGRRLLSARAGLLAAALVAMLPIAVRYGQGRAATPCSLHHPVEERTLRELAADLAPRLQPGDEVVTTSLTHAPLAYYLRPQDGVELRSFPAAAILHLGNEEAMELARDGQALAAEAASQVEEWGRTGAARGRPVWLVFVPNMTNTLLIDRLRSSKALVGTEIRQGYRQRLLGNEVTLFELRFGP